MSKMKVDVIELVNTLDPFHRAEDGKAIQPKASAMSPKMAAILEFVLSIPEKTVSPAVESMVTTSDGHVIANGNYLGTVDDLQLNLCTWMNAHNLTRIEEETVQKMLDDVIGYCYGAMRVTI